MQLNLASKPQVNCTVDTFIFFFNIIKTGSRFDVIVLGVCA